MSSPSNDTPEDYKIFEILCDPQKLEMQGEVTDMNTTLRSELAALQYKRDSLLMQLQETKTQLRIKEEKAIQLETETEHLKEQAARQNVIIASLRKRIQELEERERSLCGAQSRTEQAVTTLQREKRYTEERSLELERKVGRLELELNAEEQTKAQAQKSLSDFVIKLESALGKEATEPTLTGKGSQLIHEASHMRNRLDDVVSSLASVENELHSCRGALSKANSEKELLHRQVTSYLAELDRTKQEKQELEAQQRLYEREISELKEKVATLSRNLHISTGDVATQHVTISNLRDELKDKEDRYLRLETELRHLLESLAIILSTPVRFVESHESSIKERVRDLINDVKDKSMQTESLQEKVVTLRDQLSRLNNLKNEDERRLKDLHDEKSILESRLHKTETELNLCLSSKDGLRRDKAIFVTFLERLARALNMEEISREIGIDLHTESMLLRAEQLARLESDKLVDKSTVLYQLQRRVRNLRDQLQRRDLHIDLLRRKLTLQEDTNRTKCLLITERDDALMKVKKLTKQVDRLQFQLNEAKSLQRDLKLQLTDAGDYKLTALERGRKIEDLQKRLIESETLRTRCGRKLTLLKDQVRVTGESAEEARAAGEGLAITLRDELSSVRAELLEVSREKNSLTSLRGTLCSLLGLPSSCSDYELISRVTKLSNATREFTSVSRRYDDPVLPAVVPSPRYTTDDSGFLDPYSDDVDSEMNSIYNKRPLRTLHT